MLKTTFQALFSGTSSVPSTTRRTGREHFIPICPEQLIAKLLEDNSLSATERSRLRSLFHQFQAVLHQETQTHINRLNQWYFQVNPDRDTEDLTAGTTGADRETSNRKLYRGFVELLERANFRALTEEELSSAIGTASELGVRLHVDLDSFEQLAVYARGQMIATHNRCSWKTGFRPQAFEVPMYQRLVVLFQMKLAHGHVAPMEAVHLRLFKNVPQQDVDMTLPGGTVQLSLLERGRIMLPTLSGITMAGLKVVKVLAIAGVYGLLALIGLICSAIGSGVKTVNGYVKTKNQYELSLTKNLYYQNLDNNFGVLLRLANEAEAQELREACLGYFALRKFRRGCTEGQLDEHVERKLADLGVCVDFDVEDALAKLQRLGAAQRWSGKWVATELPSAVETVIANRVQQSFGC